MSSPPPPPPPFVASSSPAIPPRPVPSPLRAHRYFFEDKLRHTVRQDPLLDYLAVHGERQGLPKDPVFYEAQGVHYDPGMEFPVFIAEQRGKLRGDFVRYWGDVLTGKVGRSPADDDPMEDIGGEDDEEPLLPPLEPLVEDPTTTNPPPLSVSLPPPVAPISSPLPPPRTLPSPGPLLRPPSPSDRPHWHLQGIHPHRPRARS